MKNNTLWIQFTIFILLGSGAIALSNTSTPGKTNLPNAQNQAPSIYPTGRRLKISLTLTQLSDLKVKEGNRVQQGQIIADRDDERRRLNREKRETLLASAKIEQTPIPTLKLTPQINELPIVSFAIESAAIQQAELKFSQAQRVLQQSLSENPFITAKAKVERVLSEVEQAYRQVELQQRKINTLAALKNLPPEMLTHETEQLKAKTSLWEQKKAESDFTTAEFKQVEEGRKSQIASLQNSVELARSELEVAQAKYRSAKETEARKEYEHRITLARRAEEENQAQISLSNQKLDREFKLTQLQERLGAIDEKLSEIAVVRSPFTGTIKRVKIISQSGNNITIDLSLIPDNTFNTSLNNSPSLIPNP